jgi:hypothetical protein
MKKILVLLIVLLVTVPAFCAYYKSYEGTATGVTTLDAATDLSVGTVKGGYVTNDSTVNSLVIKISMNGTTFGDSITIKPGELVNLDVFPKYKKIQLIPSTSNPYRSVISVNRIAVDKD